MTAGGASRPRRRTGRRTRNVLVAAGLAVAASGCSGSATEVADSTSTTEAIGSVWVANEGGNSLTVLDAGDPSRSSTLTGLPAPHNVQAAADGSTVWTVSGAGVLVALADDGALRGSAPTEPHPAHVVAGPDERVLVTATDGQSLTSYDSSLRPAQRVALPGGPHGLRLEGAGRTAVVANSASHTVDVVDLEHGRLEAAIPVGGSPVQTAVSEDGRWAWASVATTSEVVKIDLSARTVTARQSLPAAPAQVLLTAAGDLLTADQGSEQTPGSSVSVLDPQSLEVRGRISVGAGPHGLTADSSGRTAWVTNVYDDSVSVLDVRARLVLSTVDVGDAPNGISYSPSAVLPRGRDLGVAAPGASDGGHDHGSAEHDHSGPSGDQDWWPEG